MTQTSIPVRTFLPSDFKVTTWEALEPFYQSLLDKEIKSVASLEAWLQDRSELEAVLEEDFAWRYIKMNCHTDDKALANHFKSFVETVQPHLSVWSDKLNNKIVQNKCFDELPDEPYLTYKRSLKTAVEIFRTENVPLFTNLETMAREFGVLNGAMTIEWKGEPLTMQAAAQCLESTDRMEREAVFKKITERRLRDKEAFHQLLDELVKDRHQVALNAGFKNFRDYQFKALGRFDYTPDDCKVWHQSVETHIVPLVKTLHQLRAQKLGLDVLRPWDLNVDPRSENPLQPFKTGAELLSKTKRAFKRLDPEFATYLSQMEALGHFDLESRPGKAPGGFNYPLYEVGAPFIFMNAVGTQRDLETMVHEGGHALHSFLSHHFKLNELKSTPAEVAELASMAMELISMETWDEFYESKADLNRAYAKKVEDAITTLPWVAIVDQFQHWLYEHPDHTWEDRNQIWLEINERFGSGLIDYTGFEDSRAYAWQKQMHLFEVPFYYIEYGFAQMGALSMWKNWQSDRHQTLEDYKNFMRLGYSRPIAEIYQAAGIKFDYSSNHVSTIAHFMQRQLDRLP